MQKIDMPMFEETRRCLLRIYHSDIQTHAGYLIAITIGILALISRWDSFFGENVSPLVGLAFYGILTLISVVVVYTIKRMLYWMSCTSVAIGFSADSIKNLFERYCKKENIESNNSEPYSYIFEVAMFQHFRDLKENKETPLRIRFAIMDNYKVVLGATAIGAIFLIAYIANLVF